MKKIKYLIIIAFLFVFMPIANAENYDSIKMDIYIDKDATAHITETWVGTFKKNTELYKSYGNVGESKISNYSVTMDNKEFKYIENWDINDSFEEKKYKNGINYNDENVELCLGISEYGKHTYVLKYDISNFVVNTSDYQMSYWTLLQGATINNFYIKVYSDFKYKDTLPIWGFGNYGGTAYVYDGYIEMSKKNGLTSSEQAVLIIQFEPSTFNTSVNYDKSFEDYLEMAKEGATTYIDDNSSDDSEYNFVAIMTLIVSLGLPIFIAFCAAAGADSYKYGEKGRTIPKDTPYFRDIPCNKDIFKAYYVANTYNLLKNKTDFFGCLLLKWLKDKNVTLEKNIKDGLFKEHEETSVVFVNKDNITNEYESEIYDIMIQASRDGKLEKNEFESWCKNNYNKVLNWFDKILNEEKQNLINQGLIEVTTKKMLFINKKTYYIKDQLYEDATRLYGLKKYFKDFARMHEKMPIEVHLWKEYLVFAQLFGLADKVAKEFKDLYPDVITDTSYNDIVFINNISYSGISSANTAHSRAEAYTSGGGGFSSGGGGGGSFGSGGGMGSR